MNESSAPYHAHVYYEPETRAVAERLHQQLDSMRANGVLTSLLFVGEMRDKSVGAKQSSILTARIKPFLDSGRPMSNIRKVFTTFGIEVTARNASPNPSLEPMTDLNDWMRRLFHTGSAASR
jgi:hypothetical protein